VRHCRAIYCSCHHDRHRWATKTKAVSDNPSIHVIGLVQVGVCFSKLADEFEIDVYTLLPSFCSESSSCKNMARCQLYTMWIKPNVDLLNFFLFRQRQKLVPKMSNSVVIIQYGKGIQYITIGIQGANFAPRPSLRCGFGYVTP